MSHSTYQKPLMLFAFVTMTWRSSGSFLTLLGENKFVMYERLCEELWFKVLKLCCRWYLSAMLEAFMFIVLDSFARAEPRTSSCAQQAPTLGLPLRHVQCACQERISRAPDPSPA